MVVECMIVEVIISCYRKYIIYYDGWNGYVSFCW